MAIYHLSVKPVARAQGRSATAAAAYRAADRVRDHALGKEFDYTRKRGVEHREIVLSTAAARADIHWARDRTTLWNAAEAAERRQDARIAREYEVALPHELTAAQRIALVQVFAHDLANRYLVAVDLAVHAPHRDGDARNYHAHLLTTTREVTATGLGPKSTIELSNTDRRARGLPPGAKEIEHVRAHWAALSNHALAAAQSAARIDHRSLEDQGVERVPTTHLGPSVTQLERRGQRTEVLWRIEQTITERLSAAAEAGRQAREHARLHTSMIAVETDVKAALSERAAQLESRLTQHAERALTEWRARQSSHEAREQGATASRTALPPVLEIDP